MSGLANAVHKKFHYPVAFYFTSGVTGAQLEALAMDIILRLGHCKAHPIVVNWMVCDGASDNRALMEIWHCKEDAEAFKKHLEPRFRTVSTEVGHLSIRRHPLFPSEPVVMLSDVPHLIKKARNNLEKSRSMFRNKKNEFIRDITVGSINGHSLVHDVLSLDKQAQCSPVLNCCLAGSMPAR